MICFNLQRKSMKTLSRILQSPKTNILNHFMRITYKQLKNWEYFMRITYK